MNTLRFIRCLPIRRKLTLLLLVPCVVVLVLAGAAMLWFQLSTFRKDFARDLKAVAQIVGNNSTAAIAFRDKQSATEMLNALQAKPHIVSAAIVLPDKSVFAHYGDRSHQAQTAVVETVTQRGNHVVVLAPILLEGKQIATLNVHSDYGGVYRSLMTMVGWMLFLVLIGAVVVATLLSSRLQQFVSEPVQHLAEAARKVADKNDYSIRVTEQHDPEFGLLTRTFNLMLTRIQAQDEALSLSQQKLEALIHSIDGIVWECSADKFHFTFVSRQCERILGYAPEPWFSDARFWHTHLLAEDAPRAIQTRHDAVAKGQPYMQEYRMTAADGRVVWIRESGGVLMEHNQPVAVRGILLDITEQKHAAEELDRLSRKLMDVSRQAGMAEVASGVLHNVGNVLNSVNVSATVVNDQVRKSCVAGLSKVAALLREHAADRANYLTADPKGRLVPDYVIRLAEQSEQERSALASELQNLTKNIEHIKEIVSMQQSYARVAGVLEDLPVQSLVEDALRMNAGAFQRHGVSVKREFQDVPLVRVDKHKVLQILVNLFRNAKYAMDAAERTDKQLTVGVALNGGGRVKVTVRDNGVGIPGEILTRIFQHGFTTKKEGHGFGLHSGANAAKEMGGCLYAESAGLGSGATFALELPISAPNRQSQEQAVSLQTTI